MLHGYIQIFAVALNLPDRWPVTDMKLQHHEGLIRGQLEIYIDFAAGFTIKDDKGAEAVSMILKKVLDSI